MGKLVNCELTPLAAAPGTKDMDSYVQLIFQRVISSFFNVQLDFLSQGLLSLPVLFHLGFSSKFHILRGFIYDSFSALNFRSFIGLLKVLNSFFFSVDTNSVY